jgi:hypothetical protein
MESLAIAGCTTLSVTVPELAPLGQREALSKKIMCQKAGKKNLTNS